MSLFEGLKRAHGYTSLSGQTKETAGGQKKTGLSFIKHEPVTQQLWSDHLEGKHRVGIIPINDDSLCKWGAIDFDAYDVDLKSLAKRIFKDKLPLQLIRSKSGGPHLFLFMKEWTPASLIQEKLREMAAFLMISKCEIFPKQQTISKEKQDTGNWINMPYFNAQQTTQYGFSEVGEAMSAEHWLLVVENNRLSVKELEDYAAPQGKEFSDGPPCLQILDQHGVVEGTRNSVLFQAAIYFKKKYPDTWKTEVENYNSKRIDPPLPTGEVQVIQKSVERKDYAYTCNQAPFTNVCNNMQCRARKYGVGSKGLPTIVGLTKLNSRPAIWFMSVEGQPRQLELETEDLMNQTNIKRVFMEQLNIVVPTVKRDVWDQCLAGLVEKLQVIEVSEDATSKGHFKELIERFCTGRNQAKKKEDLILGRPWHDDATRRHYFRLSDLMQFLEARRFKELGRHQIVNIIREMLGGSQSMRLNEKFVNIWWVPEFHMKEEESVTHDVSVL